MNEIYTPEQGTALDHKAKRNLLLKPIFFLATAAAGVGAVDTVDHFLSALESGDEDLIRMGTLVTGYVTAGTLSLAAFACSKTGRRLFKDLFKNDESSKV